VTGSESRGGRSPSGECVSVTQDLLARFAVGRHWGAGTPPEAMIVTYVRAVGLDESDPREYVLRPSKVLTLIPGQSFGFGRAPAAFREGLDITHALVEDLAEADPMVPRLAGRLHFEQGLWRLTSHSTGQTMVTVTAPGLQAQVSNRSPAFAIRSRRLTLTVLARSRGERGGDQVEHRFTLLSPRIPDDLPTVLTGDPIFGASGGRQTTEGALARPRWTRDQQRLLAAWAYPELIGLFPRGFRRGLMARRILRQSLIGDDPNERILSTIRRNVGRAMNVSLSGESGTPLLLDYLIARRGYLGEALAELHEEYDGAHPPRAASP
jgi:hypothetical protein